MRVEHRELDVPDSDDEGVCPVCGRDVEVTDPKDLVECAACARRVHVDCTRANCSPFFCTRCVEVQTRAFRAASSSTMSRRPIPPYNESSVVDLTRSMVRTVAGSDEKLRAPTKVPRKLVDLTVPRRGAPLDVVRDDESESDSTDESDENNAIRLYGRAKRQPPPTVPPISPQKRPRIIVDLSSEEVTTARQSATQRAWEAESSAWAQAMRQSAVPAPRNDDARRAQSRVFVGREPAACGPFEALDGDLPSDLFADLV